MMPATTATATPLPSDFAFSAISVLASSISSRTSSDAFVETSLTTSPSDLSAVLPLSVIVSASELLEKLGKDEPRHERADHRELRPANGLAGLVRLPGRL